MAIKDIEPNVVLDALNRIRRVKRGLGDSPLLELSIVQRHLRRENVVFNPTTAEWALQIVLRQVFDERLSFLRALTGAEAGAPSIESDFKVDHDELCAWSSLWHAYLASERKSIGELEFEANVSTSTFRRRRIDGSKLLADALRELELAAERDAATRPARSISERVSIVAASSTASDTPAAAYRAEAMTALHMAVTDTQAEARLSPEQVALVGEGVADLDEYRLSRVAEWSRPQHRLDERFVSLALLVDQGESAAGLRWREEEARYDSLNAVLAAVSSPAMVVLGSPGAGKSTLLRRHEIDAAEQALRSGARHVTYFVPLGRYAAPHAGEAPPAPGDWLRAKWAARYPGLPAFDALLAEGRLVLLLDALNEMPHRGPSEYRELVRAWKDFLLRTIEDHPGNRFVFSCRSLDYGAPLSTPELRVPQVRVEPFDEARIRAFLHNHVPQHADEVWEVLSTRENLGVFRTPYFLKLLADQVAATGHVPRGGAGLITGYVRQALVREIERDTPELRPNGLLTERDYERAPHMHAARDPFALPAGGSLFGSLATLAFQMQRSHAAGAGAQVRVAYDEAIAILGSADAERALDAGAALGILDEERADDQLFFLHQLLQEYFAARRLHDALDPALVRAAWRSEDVVPPLSETLEALGPAEPLPPLASTGWEETALLAAAMAHNPERFVDAIAEANLPLAGRCAGAAESELSDAARDRLRWALVGRMEDPDADLRARLAAAYALGPLGDPRFELREGPEGPYLRPPMVAIPGGTYPIGTDDPNFPQCGPAHTVELEPFHIGRFPVTNAEYALFMRAGGYEDERWWPTEAAKAWRRGEGTAEPARERERGFWRRLKASPGMLEDWYQRGMVHEHLFDLWKTRLKMSEAVFEAELAKRIRGGRKTTPEYWERPFYGSQPNQPVVGVSGYEVSAYCTWLSAQEGRAYRLPTEVEWEAAAKARPTTAGADVKSKDIGAPGNARAAHLRQPAPAGVFPSSLTIHGVADAGGNVFELTGSAWGDVAETCGFQYPYRPGDGREDLSDNANMRWVIRGEGFADPIRSAGLCFRANTHPGNRVADAGMRLAF